MARSSQKMVPSFKFKKFDKIGAVDALSDKEFLENCFVDNAGELDVLRNISGAECLVLGRTGAGKTALLQKLAQTEDRVIEISPENLALNYLTNNEALKFYMEIDVDLDLFFRVLWRHIFTVEILRLHFDITSPAREQSFFDDLRAMIFTRQSRKIARDYLLERRDFWKETIYQIESYTKKLETDFKSAISATLAASLGGLSGELQLSPEAARKLTEEQTIDVRSLGQEVVNKQQMQELTEVIDLLGDELITDRKRRYFITIDRLDEKWVHDPLRYKLIRALIETAKFLNNRLETVKIIIAIRQDLLERVFRTTRGSLDQFEKYRDLYLELTWSRKSLKEVLERRINQLIAHSYSKSISVKVKDILPEKVNKQETTAYVFDRTFLMPRDVIVFFNECIIEGEGKPKLSQVKVLAAEGNYSSYRLTALADEWSADYPGLLEATDILKKRTTPFVMSDISRDEFDDFMLDFVQKRSVKSEQGFIYALFYEKLGDLPEVLPELLRIFFRVGILGIKNESFLEVYWSFNRKRVRLVEINDGTRFHIHPAFWRVLGING